MSSIENISDEEFMDKLKEAGLEDCPTKEEYQEMEIVCNECLWEGKGKDVKNDNSLNLCPNCNSFMLVIKE